MKIIYVMTGLELGEIHPEFKQSMYELWSKWSDESLADIGLKRVYEEGEVPEKKGQ